MKSESLEQLNALKACPFSPGAIWSEQQVLSVVKIHVPVMRKTRNLNPESFKHNFNGYKRIQVEKMGSGRFSRVGLRQSPALLLFYEALRYVCEYS